MGDKKSDASAIIPSQVRELIRDSQRIQGWVDRLSEHSEAARPEVFAKVRADYDERLSKVNADLSEHRMQLIESLEMRRSEVESLRTDRDEHQAELEEAKLRHAVGEYDDREFGRRRDTIKEALDGLDELLEQEEGTVTELDDIIASIGGAGGPRLVVDRAEPAPAEGRPIDTSPPADADVATTARAPDGGEDVASVEAPASEAPAAPPAGADEPAEATVESPPAEDPTSTDGDGGEYLDELEFLESLSLGDSDRFDAVSAMLDDEESGKGSDA
ncbi:MAG: hypothetical protein MJB57_04205 [Gemmatimonadetes bacterium]|nr:hypothetical protein [Gemmatimonadota bacterium]